MDSASARVLPYGEGAVLVEVADAAAALRLAIALGHLAIPGVLEIVPAAVTVLVRLDPMVADASVLSSAIQASIATESATIATPVSGLQVVIVPVVYDGADLADVAARTALSVDEVIARHCGATYRCAFCGFAPGFSYLIGGDPALFVGRRREPRAFVPRGSVAIAGQFSAVYPADSPGGWSLLGRTDAVMWDATRPSPALAPPGAQVRFVPVRGSAVLGGSALPGSAP
jgi:KipI family sensor histidine kinase inhibitor